MRERVTVRERMFQAIFAAPAGRSD